MALQKAPRGQCDCHGREQYAHQRRDVEKFFRAFQRRANLGARVADAFNALAWLQLRGKPIAIGVYRFGAARDLQPITDAATGLYQTGGREIGFVQHHARPGVDETDGRIGFLCHHGSRN